MCKVLIFTDLDGSLLDHHTYSFTPALPVLRHLKQNSIPVIIVSSKTRAEIMPLVSQLGLDGPVIAENGAVIAYPDGSVDCSADIADIRASLNDLPDTESAAIQGFGDMSVAEISNLTGLNEDVAALAAQREATEPFVWCGEGVPDKKLLADKGYQIIRGGRFYHIVPARDKAAAIQLVKTSMEADDAQIWALGDGPNDLGMLLAADKGALIRNPDLQVKPDLPASHGLFMTTKTGPAGWAEAVTAFLGDN